MAPPSNVHRCLLQSDALDAVRSWTNEIASWPAGSHVWGHYAEVTDSGPAICRTENVSACHGGYSGLVNGLLRDVAAEALGQPVTDFKDKINYKQPGGAGFRPHQDVVAYPDAGTVMSVLVAIDDCTEESGCIWLADGITTVLETDDRGVVREDIATELNWYPVALAAGDAVCLDGFAPHFSDANRSREQRRVLVASYAATDEHYTRDHYYSARRATMSSASGKDGRFRISTLADFAGDEVAPDRIANDVCTHSPI
ncbi:MAG: hypothetical protein EXQ69_03500 [Acidimicrobiia bacterium]|nr:hypothetical protein [Acidimicrobiia bacterium]